MLFRSGIGEATYLTGYTDETIDESWSLVQQLAQDFCGRHEHEVASRLDKHYGPAPFTATAFNTAIEMAASHRMLNVERPERAPVLGLLNATETAAIEQESQQLFAQGFTTLKVKVGFDATADAAMVKRVQHALKGRGRIRLDANQGYSRDDALRFVAALDPADIELFEQPCAAGDRATLGRGRAHLHSTPRGEALFIAISRCSARPPRTGCPQCTTG